MNSYILKDSWLEIMLHRPVFQLKFEPNLIEYLKDKKTDEYKNFHKILHLKNVFLFTKIRTTDIDIIKFLNKYNFSLIDTNVIFKKKITSSDITIKKNISIKFAHIRNKKEIMKLSRESFIYSRFHIDDKIPNEIANDIKSKWVENFFNGRRGDDLIIASLDDKISGFILLIKSNDNIIIDLIAVHEKFRGKNIAKSMIYFLEKNYSNFNNILVGTQIVNIPSINLYESCGFRLYESNYVFHYHNV